MITERSLSRFLLSNMKMAIRERAFHEPAVRLRGGGRRTQHDRAQARRDDYQ